MSQAFILTKKLREALEDPFANDIGSGMGQNSPDNSFTCGECGYQVNDYLGASIVSCPKCGSIMNNDSDEVDHRDLLKTELKAELKQELKPKESPEKTKEKIKTELKQELKPKYSSEKVRDELLAEIDKLKAEIETIKDQQPQAPEEEPTPEPDQETEDQNTEDQDTGQDKSTTQPAQQTEPKKKEETPGQKLDRKRKSPIGDDDTKAGSSSIDQDLDQLTSLVGEALKRSNS